MFRPPDPKLSFDKNKKLETKSPDGKYLIITRTESNQTLEKVNLFFVKKIIDLVCESEIESCKRLRNGSLLIKTKNASQAQKLITLTSFSDEIKINITEHKALNSVKGVVYSNEFRGISEEELKSELANQKVIEVKKIMKWENNKQNETGLAILTFDSTKLPEYMYIAYEKKIVKPYIPSPMHCKNCLKYGHLIKFCKSKKTCYNCGNEAHTNIEAGEICQNVTKCLNCINSAEEQYNHTALDKQCPTFIRQKEIQAIRTIERIDFREATKRYHERHINNTTFANIIKPTINTQETRATTSYADLETTQTSKQITPQIEQNSTTEKQPPKTTKTTALTQEFPDQGDFKLLDCIPAKTISQTLKHGSRNKQTVTKTRVYNIRNRKQNSNMKITQPNDSSDDAEGMDTI